MTTGGSSAAVKAALEASLGAGFLQGLELLGAYAQQDMQDDETAKNGAVPQLPASHTISRPRSSRVGEPARSSQSQASI
jgi:hypothetical protein